MSNTSNDPISEILELFRRKSTGLYDGLSEEEAHKAISKLLLKTEINALNKVAANYDYHELLRKSYIELEKLTNKDK